MEIQNRLTTNVIPPAGPLGAKICFIGEAPGKDEDHFGVPFVGSAGQLLNRCLSDVGITRSEVLINNVFSQRPPNNNIEYFFGKSKMLTWEGQSHVDQFESWLRNMKESPYPEPNILVALGATALKILTGKKRITKWRGSLLPCTLVPGYKVYPTFHPSFVNRLLNETREKLIGEKKKQQQNILPIFLRDLRRVVEQSEFPEINYPQRELLTNLSFHELKGKLTQLIDEAPIKRSVAVDIETLRGPDGPILWCIGFSSSPDTAFVVPFLQSFQPAWPLEQEAELLILISEVFLEPRLQKIFQGGGYDLSVLGRYYGLRVNSGTYEDTMWLHYTCYPAIRKGLNVLASIYTWEPYYKDEGKVHLGKRSSDQAEFRYNGKDCCVTRECFSVLRTDAKELDLWTTYQNAMLRMGSLLGMMIRGVRIDIEKKDKLSILFRNKAVYHREALVELSKDPTFNPGSSAQLKVFLYEKRGLKQQINRRTKRPTTDKDALNKLHRLYPNEPSINHILKFRKFDKLASTYADMIVDSDGRLHTSYQFISTWRLSSSESPFGSGGNLQNIPNTRTEEGKLIRKLFIPDPGLLWGKADYSQIEARIVAWESEDLRLIELFLDPETDVHWENACAIFFKGEKIPYTPSELIYSSLADLTKPMSFFRNVGKTCTHASNYDMSHLTYQVTLTREGIIFPVATCRSLLDTYKTQRPMLGEWKRKIREQVRDSRTLVSSYGRKKEFTGRLNDDLYRSAYAFSPQSTAGELLEDAAQEVWEQMPNVQLLLSVHDEIDFQFKPEDKEVIKTELRQRMEKTITIHGRDLTIPVDFEFGTSWGSLKGEK